jgi:hypothetical protein
MIFYNNVFFKYSFFHWDIMLELQFNIGTFVMLKFSDLFAFKHVYIVVQ